MLCRSFIPHGPRVGSALITHASPRAAQCSASLRKTVLLPAPSIPSTTTSQPGAFGRNIARGVGSVSRRVTRIQPPHRPSIRSALGSEKEAVAESCAAHYKRTPFQRHLNQPHTMPIAVGTKAPDFTLKSKDANGLKDVTLSANFGKTNTVILFFPLAFTGVCTDEMCDVSQGLNGYADLGAEVIGISVDSPFAQEAWAQTKGIKVTLLSDLDKKTIAAYGVEFPGLAGIGTASARAAFIVDKNGVVQYAEQTPTPKDLPNFEAIKAKLAQLK
jgi:peroxiredoxin